MTVFINNATCNQILIASDTEHISTMLHELAYQLQETDNDDVDSIMWDGIKGGGNELVAIIHFRLKP